jgi:hypothetical protein
MSDLLERAIRAHGGAQRWEQVSRRRVYVRRPDGSPILESTSIAIDVEWVRFS